jgi:hypothetical protein
MPEVDSYDLVKIDQDVRLIIAALAFAACSMPLVHTPALETGMEQ